MLCPVELAHDLSALQAARVRDHGKHGILLEGRDGVGDESTGRDFAGDGEEDYLVPSGGDHRDRRPAHGGSATRKAGIAGGLSGDEASLRRSGFDGGGGAGVGAVSGEVF
jgi:hypothetical protein